MTRPDTPLLPANRASRRTPTTPTIAAPAADDAELLARCIAGDATAWTALVQRYQRLVYAIVGRMGLDAHAAADVFQTVFSRLLQHLPRIADPSRLQAWIVTTAKRESLLQRKLMQRSVSISRDDDADGDDATWDWADESPIAEEALADLQQLHQLREAMSRLDERSRRVLQLLFREDGQALPYDEVARELGIPVGSVGPTRARCLDKLRRLVTAS
jgi:RNA polymerase sigma factor (sigma-70 family)